MERNTLLSLCKDFRCYNITTGNLLLCGTFLLLLYSARTMYISIPLLQIRSTKLIDTVTFHLTPDIKATSEKKMIHSDDYGYFDIQNYTFIPTVPESTPTVAIIGTAKGGTSDLFHVLTNLFHFVEPVEKELNNLRITTPIKFCDTNFRLYAARLHHSCGNTNFSEDDCIRCYNRSIDILTLDGSPDYFHDSYVAENLKRISPNTKLIFMIRDPIDRAYSLYNHWQIEQNIYGNKTLEDCANEFFHWRNSSFISEDRPQSVKQLHTLLEKNEKLQNISNVVKYYRKLRTTGIRDEVSLTIFSGGYYRYALYDWYFHYLKPGNIIIIDAHLYFECRECVLNQVSLFLRNRKLNSVELKALGFKGVENRKVASGIIARTTRWSNSTVDKLRGIFSTEIQKLFKLLAHYHDDGYFIYGFNKLKEPWNQYFINSTIGRIEMNSTLQNDNETNHSSIMTS